MESNMKISDQLRNLLPKAGGARSRDTAVMDDGRRPGENDNPYLSARRTWNDHVGAVRAAQKTWQMVGLLALLIVLACVGGMIHIGSQSKFVPMVIEVDKFTWQARVGAPAQPAAPGDLRVVRAAVAQFISNARLVTPDIALQRHAVFNVYAMLSANDPATVKMNEWLNGTADSSPFKRAAKETVSTEIKSVLQQTPETWQVDWVETVRDREGNLKGPALRMRALVTVYTTAPTPQTTEEQLLNNPLGTYCRDFSWSKQM
jgi:type IV secretory pathway TrbF-like protein